MYQKSCLLSVGFWNFFLFDTTEYISLLTIIPPDSSDNMSDPNFGLRRGIARAVIKGYFRNPVNVRYEGEIPEGPVLYLFNHTSNLDNFVLYSELLPVNYYLLASRFFFTIPVIRNLLPKVGIVPAWLSGLRTALRKMPKGDSVALAPEGTRVTEGELGHLYEGAGFLVGKHLENGENNLSAVPVIINYSERNDSYPALARFKMPLTDEKYPKADCQVTMVVGEPMDLSRYHGMTVKEVRRKFTIDLRKKMVDMLYNARNGSTSQ